jgi:hypothetical protein
MTLPTATKPIFSKLQTKLALQQTNQPKLFLSDAIIPVVDVDFILAQTKAQQVSSTATTRTDVYTVPQGKFWKVKSVSMNRANTGALDVYCGIDSAANCHIAATATSTLTAVLINDLKLKGGDTISLNAQSGTSGTIILSITYEEYDA